MTKEIARLNHRYQKSSNQYMILLTIIIALVSFLDSLPQKFKIYAFWVLSLSITLFGLLVISLNADELVYTWKALKDKRKRVSKFERVTSLIVYLFIALMGLLIIALGGYLMLVLSGFFPNPLS